MAGASLLALIDDIATILDDVAVMSKVAAKKTAGVLGDDLALNAQQVSGVHADRELPVVWAVAIGSLRNKVILVPAALVISALVPWAVAPLLMMGGLYLCLEGVEKLTHTWLHSAAEDNAHHAEQLARLADDQLDLAQVEAEKIRGAIRTDFVLSAEIIVIALGTVADKPFMSQVVVLSTIGVLMTAGVYGFVAAIVKLDDLGLVLLHRANRLARFVGRMLLLAAPRLMKALTVVGTAAMFAVGGGILVHGIPPVHHAIEKLAESVGNIAGWGPFLMTATPLLLDVLVGMVGGLIALAVVQGVGAARSGVKGLMSGHAGKSS